MQVLTFFGGVWNGIREGFYGILMILDGFIYGLIGSAYKVFMAIASARLLSSDAYSEIANKVYIIIGVVMLFVLSYAILQGIIDPDKNSKGDMSGEGLLKRVLIAVLGLALAPVLFNILYQAQGLFLEKNVLNRIFFRTSKDMVDAQTYQYNTSDGQVATVEIPEFDNNDNIYSIGGNYTATSIWSSFFYPTYINQSDELKEKCDGGDDDACKSINPIATWAEDFISYGEIALGALACGAIVAGVTIIAGLLTLGVGLLVGVGSAVACGAILSAGRDAQMALSEEDINLYNAYIYTSSGGDYDIYTAFIPNIIDKKKQEKNGAVNYVIIISTIAGIFSCYAFVNFSIDMGVRAAKLAYYQIIAPVPIVMQILPKFKDRFNKYLSNVFATWMEVFIRIIVVYVVIFVICHLPDVFSVVRSDEPSSYLTTLEFLFSRIFLIMGILIFAQRAPKLISETLGISGEPIGLGLKAFKEKLGQGGAFAAMATVGAMATTSVRNWRRAFTGRESLARQLGRAATSSLAGAGSAGFRSIRDQFLRGDRNQRAMSFESARNQAAKSAEAATDARDARKRFRAEQHNKGRDGVKAFVVGHGENIVDRVNAWSVGTVDTSYIDGHNRTLNSLKGLEGKLEESVVNDALVKDAQRKMDMVNNFDIADIAYNLELDSRATSLATDHVLANMSKFDKEAEWVASGRSAATFDENMFEQGVRDGSIITSWTQMQIAANKDVAKDALSNSATGTFKRSDYTVDIQSQEYKDAQALLSKQMKDAAAELKKSKQEAVQRKLAEAATGLDNSTSRTIKEFLQANQKDLRAFASEELFKNPSGRSISIGEYISTNFGNEALANGTLDLGEMLGKRSNVINYKIQNSSGSYNGNVTVTNTGSGISSYTVEEVDSSGTVINTVTFTNQADYMEYINSHDVSKVKDSTLTGDRMAITEDLKSRAETAQDALLNSAEYREAQAMKRAQQEKK